MKAHDPFGVIETLEKLEVLSKRLTVYMRKRKLLVVLPDGNGGLTLAVINFAHYKVQYHPLHLPA